MHMELTFVITVTYSPVVISFRPWRLSLRRRALISPRPLGPRARHLAEIGCAHRVCAGEPPPNAPILVQIAWQPDKNEALGQEVSFSRVGADGQELDMLASGDLHTTAEAINMMDGCSGTRQGHDRSIGGSSGSSTARCGLRRHLESTCRGCSSCWPTGASAS